ncbi:MULTISPECIES: NAD(P)-dependent alcohol dehydrogenase [unclassified Beijerinckia]|uniref:NAD(P)-dependent alcohol dehydrogenase n=1 Tax=unclassified Beijerinckia TaxID=2638183 RepID=UPI0008981364|nr:MULTISPECIES: NAD(P)-dependent alcohol dehydrogenase [unclassified Beijerinckia]MDH7796565.1 aryl-alcohol dehydrogenase [Beijerinckia sp. GAS462]SEC50536.1 aryl-alcohol dehydrogenase [Beijerinckia sp. 28-YEA-48]
MKVRAAVFRDGTLNPSFEDLTLAGPRAGEVLVKIVASGVCHTDLKSAGKVSPVPKPVVLGHEGAGVVEAVGAGVTKVAKGDHVVLTFGFCGHCPSCADAEPAYCYNQGRLNFECTPVDGLRYTDASGNPVHGDFFSQSSFATYAVGHERNVVKVRKDAPLELLGPLGCGIQTGAGAILNDFKLQPGQTLAVFGVGALGLSAVMAARIAGASRIVAVDRHAHRLDLARDLGADLTIVAGSEPTSAEILKQIPGGVDFALDTTGVLPVMRQAIDSLAPRGMAGFVTSPWDGSELSVSVRHLLLGRKIRGIIEGNSNPDVFIPMLVDFFMQGRFPFDRLVQFYNFDEIAKAFHDSEDGKTVKPVLRIAA